MKKKLNVMFLFCMLFCGLRLSAQTVNISTGVDNFGSLIPWYNHDDDWIVHTHTDVPGYYGPVSCTSGYVEGYGCVLSALVMLDPTIRFLSPWISVCSHTTASYIGGAYYPGIEPTTDPITEFRYNYRRTFTVNTCDLLDAEIKIYYEFIEDHLDTILINGVPYPINVPYGLGYGWLGPTMSIPINPSDLIAMGTNTIEMLVVNYGYDTGMALNAEIIVHGANGDPAFSLGLNGAVLSATPDNYGTTQTWQVFGSASGIPGSYTSLGTYTTTGLATLTVAASAAYKCYYVEHTLTNYCGSLCAAQSVCSSNCVTGPNPCSLATPEKVQYYPEEHQCVWTPVPGAAYYILQVQVNDPACCSGDSLVPATPVNIPVFGVIRTIDALSDLGTTTPIENLCFSWRVIPVCQDGTNGMPSEKVCSGGNAPLLRTKSPVTSIAPTRMNMDRTRVNIFPNPAKGMVSLNIETGTDTEFTVTITDLMGRLIRSFDSKKTVNGKATITWNTESMAKGAYLVKFLPTGKQSIDKKLIIE